MSYDVKLFCACNHIVDGKTYDIQLCPRCYGKGYYYDIYFDKSNQAVLTSGSIKLQQEMLKVIIDEKYKNKFHPLWGSEIGNVIGTKNANLNKTKIEMIVRTALEHLQSIQINEYLSYKNLNFDEIIDTIQYINITPIDSTGYNVEIIVSNKVGELFSQTVTI